MTIRPRVNPMAKTTVSGFMAPREGPRLRRDELQGHAVVAVAQARGARTVVEHVTLMAQAPGAVILRARHADHHVVLLAQGAGDGGVGTGPAGAAVELPRRFEQRQVAAEAGEGPMPVLVVQRAGVSPFGAVLAQHSK